MGIRMDKKDTREQAGLLYHSLIRSITLAGIVLIAAVLGISIWTLRQDWNDTVRQSEETATNLALSQARQAEDTFLQTELAMREMQRDVESQLVTGINSRNLSQTMRELQGRLPQLHGLFYYDAQGKWIATSASQIPADINNSDREYFRFQRDNPRNSIHLGPVIRSRSTGDLVIPVSLRISDALRGFQGVLLATVKVDYFRHFYAYYEMGAKDVLVLMLADSSVLYARPMPDSFIGKDLSSSHLFQQMLQGTNRGSGQWTSALDGKPRIFGFARSDRYPLVVAAGYDTHSLFIKWMKGRVQDVLLSLALLSAIVAMGVFVLRQARHSLHYQFELTSLRDELSAANHALNRLAHADALTGLANRRAFDRYLNECILAADKHNEPVSLVMIDIDYFKRYNDTYGHVAGDECLKRVAQAINAISLRGTDLVARYGGEEFAIVLPGADIEHAMSVAAAAVQAVREQDIIHDSSLLASQRVTLSAGCASLNTERENRSAQLLIRQADMALYSAKQAGRNQVKSDESYLNTHS